MVFRPLQDPLEADTLSPGARRVLAFVAAWRPHAGSISRDLLEPLFAAEPDDALASVIGELSRAGYARGEASPQPGSRTLG